MKRRQETSALVLAAVVSVAFSLLTTTPCVAQTETVAVVIARSAPLGDIATVHAQVVEALSKRGLKRVTPPVLPAPREPDSTALNQLREKGHESMRDLASDVSAAEMLDAYQPSINRALELASSVTGDERKLLWSMCVLRVQLYTMVPGNKIGNPVVDDAVRECRLRFPDQLEFSKIWSEEVVAAFRAHDKSAKTVSLEVRSAPEGCDVLVYGAAVGQTPLRVKIEPGLQEVQVRCGASAYSLLHRVDASRPAALAVSLAGDAAYRADLPDAIDLSYPGPSEATKALDDASAFGREAGAQGLLLLASTPDGIRLSLHRGESVRSVDIGPSADGAHVHDAVDQLFGSSKAKTESTRSSAVTRTVDDYGVAFAVGVVGLAGAGGYLGAALHAGNAHGASLWVPIGVASACVVAGVAILWAAPFGRRNSYRAQLGIDRLTVGGTF